MKKNLFFVEDEDDKKGRKTERWNVYSNPSYDHLGKIRWNCAWRCYVMDYREDIMMSVSCMEELNEFMNELEEKRKANLKPHKKTERSCEE